MKKIKSIIGSSVGNILEWYDFGLFAIYSPLFARQFFPTSDPHVALISVLGVFAIGFLCRPLGALLFGYLGDRQGRVKTLRLSILMISVPTLLIGCLPTYATIGIGAPLLLMLIRIWQGISLGGEFSGNLIYLAETAPKKHRAFITSFAGAGANLGILLAAAVSGLSSYFFSDARFESWGWRIPYIASGIITLFVYLARLQMQETDAFSYLKNKKILAKDPILLIFRNNILQMLRTIGLVCMGSTFYYLCFVYMTTFLINNLHFSITKATTIMTFFIGTMIVFVPLSGMLCDYLGRRKMLLFNAVLISLIAIPGYYLILNQSIFVVLLVLGAFTLASSLEQATTCVAVVENYPMPARYTGLSFAYNVGLAIFGGTTPLLCEWLIDRTHFSLIPAFYILVCALITGLVVYFWVPETKNESLV